MAKTTPSRRAKSKTKAPKKKPTQLDRIEKKLDTIHRTVVVRADSIHATLVDTKRSIGSIESKLSTLNAWEMLNEAMSEAKLASPTVAVEEEPAEGDYMRIVRVQHESLGRICTVEEVRPQHLGWLLSNDCWYAKANLEKLSPEEIAAHEAKLKAEAQAAEDAKLVFGARVECEGREWYIASITPDKGGHYLIARTDNAGLYMSWRRQRNEFTLLP